MSAGVHSHTHRPRTRPRRDLVPRAIIAGILVRYSVWGYLQRMVVVVSALLLIALTIDLIKQGEGVVKEMTTREGTGTVQALVYFSMLRLPDLAANLMVVSTFLAVLWWEVQQNMSNERTVIWTTGRSPVQGMAAALILGCLMWPVQFGLDVYLRPLGVGQQIEDRLGKFGRWFDRTRINQFQWISVGDDLLRARIRYGPPTELLDVSLYRLTPGGRLKSVVIAKKAVPAGQDTVWTFQQVERWDPAPPALNSQSRQFTQPDSRETEILYRGPSVASRQIVLNLSQLWVRNFDIHAELLPQDVLRRLSQDHPQDYKRYNYETWYHFRHARSVLPLLVALLAASVALLTTARKPTLVDFAIIFLSGYAVHVAVKTAVSLGELGYLPPLVAAWIVPVCVGTVVTLLLLRASRRAR